MMETLVLNTAWQPVSRISWQRAITQWVKGKVEIIDSYEDRTIASATIEMQMPCIVRELTGMISKKKAIKFSRENVYTRDKGMCQYCRKKVPRAVATYDHVIPRTQGGKTKWTNVVISCFDCNQCKKDRQTSCGKENCTKCHGVRRPMRPAVAPIKPKSLPNTIRFTFVWKKDMPYQWRDYLYDIKYWHSQLDE